MSTTDTPIEPDSPIEPDAPVELVTPAPDHDVAEIAGASIAQQPISDQPSQGVEAAEGIKEAVVAKSDTFGGIVEALDSWALEIGDERVSLWDGLVVVIVIVGLFVVAHVLSKFAHAVLKRVTTLDSTQRLLAEKLLTIFVWAAATLVGIDMLGIDLTALAVFSGAFGLAIGFGLQKTFGNLIAGIILLMDRSIKPGDVISVADAAGKDSFGQIRKIGIRAISVITRDRTEYLIPNENLMVNQVVNWSYSSRDVRVKAPVGVSYGTDMAKAEELMLQAAKDTPRVLDWPEPVVLMMGFGESSVDFEIRFWIDDPEDGLSNIRSDVLKRVWQLFHENGIEIPFPQRDINLRGNDQFAQLIAAISQRAGNRDKGNGPDSAS